MKQKFVLIVLIALNIICACNVFAEGQISYIKEKNNLFLANEAEFDYTGKYWIANTAIGKYYDFDNPSKVETYINMNTETPIVLGNQFMDYVLETAHKKPTDFKFKWARDKYLAIYSRPYLMWNAPGYYEYSNKGVIYAVAEDFSNIIDKYETPGLVADLAVIGNICYILVPQTNAKFVLYYSSDLINWFEYGDVGCLPLSYSDGNKGIFPLYEGRSKIYGKGNLVDTYKVYAVINGMISNEIIYESMNAAEIFGCDNYVFTYRDNTLYISNDGIYWTKMDIPEDNCCELKMVYNYKDEKIIFPMLNQNNEYDVSVVFDKDQLYEEVEEQLHNNEIYVKYKEKILGFEQIPIIEGDRTLVPMRFLFEQMGADVDWNGSIQAATATLNDTAVTFAINDTEAEVNNTPVLMDVPARLINGKTMVPLRFLSEELGYTVTWDEETRTASIE